MCAECIYMSVVTQYAQPVISYELEGAYLLKRDH